VHSRHTLRESRHGRDRSLSPHGYREHRSPLRVRSSRDERDDRVKGYTPEPKPSDRHRHTHDSYSRHQDFVLTPPRPNAGHPPSFDAPMTPPYDH
jgi:hypothetical protein